MNYHDDGTTVFTEPLTQTTRPFWLCSYRIPTIDALHLHEAPVDCDDKVIELVVPQGQPVLFAFLICPMDFAPPGAWIKLDYAEERYSLAICIEHGGEVREGYEAHFVTVKPTKGQFEQQQISEAQALIRHHQALTGAQDVIIYTPNDEGYITLVFAVPMRIAPKFKIELMDSNLYVADEEVQRDKRAETVMLRFRVRHKRTQRIIRTAVPIRSLELDAEL